MAKKEDFDKIDTNKDGFISRDEFDAADDSAGIEREKLNWFLRLITLGDRFDIKDFYDRIKKSVVEFVILVFGVTVSFGIEQQGGESDNRHDGIENLVNLREEVESIIEYTDAYIEQINWVTELFQKQYDKWEKDNDSIFIDWQPDEEEDLLAELAKCMTLLDKYLKAEEYEKCEVLKNKIKTIEKKLKNL